MERCTTCVCDRFFVTIERNTCRKTSKTNHLARMHCTQGYTQARICEITRSSTGKPASVRGVSVDNDLLVSLENYLYPCKDSSGWAGVAS